MTSDINLHADDDTHERWTADRKSAVVIQLIRGETTVTEVAQANPELTTGEVQLWFDDFLAAGRDRMRMRHRDAEGDKVQLSLDDFGGRDVTKVKDRDVEVSLEQDRNNIVERISETLGWTWLPGWEGKPYDFNPPLQGLESNRHRLRRSFGQWIRERSGGLGEKYLSPIGPRRTQGVTREVLFRTAFIFLIDISSSVTDSSHELAVLQASSIDVLLPRMPFWGRDGQYEFDRRYIVYDGVAREVPSEECFQPVVERQSEPRISPAYRVVADTIEKHYTPTRWCIYVFQFSCGDNSGDDREAMQILNGQILPHCCRFLYANVGENDSGYLRSLQQSFGNHGTCLVVSEIEKQEDIIPSILKFFREQ